MSLDRAELVRAALARVKYPGFSRDIVSFGLVQAIDAEGPVAKVRLAVTTADAAVPRQIKEEATRAVEEIPGVERAEVEVAVSAPVTLAAQTQAPGAPEQNAIPGVKKIVAVASGKGGVGKSTVAAGLALALREQGFRVGLCDCDIYGPSIALMFGAHEAPLGTDDNRILPVEAHGLQLMSMGFLLEDDAPAVLRGPMVTRYTQQFLRNVSWTDLDYLILDLPPGTGDIQLTIVQTVALAGALVVTTPQEVALIDARKAAAMFRKVNVPVLGIVENMSYFLCPGDGKRYNIFGEGGGKREAARLGVPYLGEIPIEIPLRESADQGAPLLLRDPAAPSSQAFAAIARQLTKQTQEIAAK
ncbi:MAG: Mrp/NBP35 family ATP-binding protein [Verrucomicrobium sp.]|nr:Mrp/NBP35 family ATP-binding protein [Verrucomicrobium sp.]